METNPVSPADGARVVRRAVSLLREVSASRGNDATLKMLADSAGLPQPTAHRLLKVLQAEGLLERDPASRAYCLGSLLYEFGLAAAPRVDARRLCAGTLECVTRAVGDTTYLNCRSGHGALCLDRREGTFEIRALPIEIGNRRPLGVGAGALAVLASLPSAEVDAAIEFNATRYRRHGLTAERIRLYVEATRARGFAITSGRIVGCYRASLSRSAMASAAHPPRFPSSPWPNVSIRGASNRSAAFSRAKRNPCGRSWRSSPTTSPKVLPHADQEPRTAWCHGHVAGAGAGGGDARRTPR